MEDLITIIIIVIGVAIKIFGAIKKRAPAPESSDTPPVTWEEFLDEVENNPELREAVESDPELQQGYEAARLQQQRQAEALQKAQAEKDAALLEQQRVIAEMAARAQAANLSSMAEESSIIYTQNGEGSDSRNEENNDPADWAELIRSNRTEAVVISEILAQPAALR